MQMRDENTPERRGRNPILRGFTGLLAVVGLATIIYLVAGLAVDISEFDQTSGGYDYPFDGWTGTPVDYSEMFITPEGMYKRGRVIDLYFNCETGMISYSFLSLGRGDFREFSDRAKAVHQPQIACQEFGFDTSTWGTIDDPDGLFTDLNAEN